MTAVLSMSSGLVISVNWFCLTLLDTLCASVSSSDAYGLIPIPS